MGHREPDERVRRFPVVQRCRQGPVRAPAGVGPVTIMRFATFEHAGAVRAGIVVDASTGPMVHPLPAGPTVVDLVRAGLPAALDAGASALAEPGITIDQVRLLPQ